MSNMISTLRRQVKQNGNAVISIDEFNQLQVEWVRRESSGLASLEAMRDQIVRDITEANASPEIEDAINVAYDFIYESVTKTLIA